MENLSIGIVGNGVVGNALANCYSPFYKVKVYDINPLRKCCLLSDIIKCDIIFLCLPTPQKQNSLELDISAIHDFFREVRYSNEPNTLQKLNLVIKSTVPIGTTRKISEEYQLTNIVHSPEFLTERTANIDAIMPRVNIIGEVEDGTDRATGLLEEIYMSRFKSTELFFCGSDESEAIKLTTNAFFAAKISFFNEMFQLCKAMNLDWNTVLSGMLADGRISHSHTQVPGTDGKYGYGGKCLPKDLAQLIRHEMESKLINTEESILCFV